MTSYELKKQLNEELIIKILENINCHNIKTHKKYITARIT
jgi:hypothetical protein